MSDSIFLLSKAAKLREVSSELQALSYLFATQDPSNYEASATSDNAVGFGLSRIVGRLARRLSKLADEMDTEAFLSGAKAMD